MRYFFLFLIALFVSGGLAVAHPSPEIFALKNPSAVKTTELTSFQLNDNNAIEVNGIRFETIVPNPILTVPKESVGATTPIQFGVRITNNTSEPVRIRRDSLTPELLGLNNQFLFPAILQHGALTFTESDFSLIAPKQNITLFWKGSLVRDRIDSMRSLMVALIDNRLRRGFYFSPFMPGIFQIRLTYTNTDEETTSEDIQIQESKQLAGVLTGRFSSPWVKIKLVGSGNTNTGKITEFPSVKSTENNAVEVNRIRFEALVPTRTFKIPENQEGADTRIVPTPMRFGIRIVNKTSEPVSLKRNNFTLEIARANGEAVSSTEGVQLGLMSPGKLDFPLVSPGESLSLFWSGGFSWSYNILQLFMPQNNTNALRYFRLIKPGIYRIRLTYNTADAEIRYYDQERRKLIEPLRRALIGKLSTPWVEINLVKP